MEEIKPNLYKLDENTYLSKRRKGWALRYPIKKEFDKPFNGDNINYKNLFRFDGFSMFFVLMVLILSYSYYHDTRECFNLIENPRMWCSNWELNITMGCSEEQQSLGLCYNATLSDYNFQSMLGEKDGEGDNPT